MGSINIIERDEIMGTDIHICVENCIDDKWQVVEKNNNLFWLYHGRNYDLFAILGNVRNGSGFAGVITGTGFNSISNNRGLPNNASIEVIKELNDEEEFYHSISYITLAELLSFDWDQVTIHYGIVNEEQYTKFKQQGYPSSWPNNICGKMIENVLPEIMDLIIDGSYEKQDGFYYYTHITWTVPYSWSVGKFIDECIPKLQELGFPENVRIIFGFDN